MNKILSAVIGGFLGVTLATAVGVGMGVGNNNPVKSDASSSSPTYLHAFSAKPSTTNTNTLSNIVWTKASGTNIGSYNSANYCGVQIGTKSASGSLTISSNSNWGADNGNSAVYGKTRVTSVYLWLNAGTNVASA